MEIKKVSLLGSQGNKSLSIGAAGVIINKGKVLLVRGRGGDKFKFPGGHVEDQENFKEAACREVMEEIGCSIEAIGEPVFYKFIFDSTLEIILVHYLAKISEGTPKPSSEIEEIKWVDIDKLPENAFDNVSIVLKELIEEPI